MSCDLERLFGPLAVQLPESCDSEPFALDESVLPKPPAELFTDRLRGTRGYLQRLPGCRGDYVQIIAPRPVFRHIGLLTLALLFHDDCNSSHIHLVNPESQLKHLIIEYGHVSSRDVAGFRIRPRMLGYVPDEANHTFSTDEVGPSRPILRLTNLSDNQRNETDWQSRDTLRGIGGTYATAEVAEFLLNAGRSNATCKSFTIPANGDFFTAEVRFWIPEEWQKLQTRLAELTRGQP